MQINQKYLCKIYENSLTITERLMNCGLVIDKNQYKALKNDIRINQWCQVIADGNWENFNKYLAWNDLDFKKIRETFSHVNISNCQLLPSWTETFKECLECSTTINTSKTITSEYNLFLDPQEVLPFEEIILPFIYVASNKLKSQAGATCKFLSENAYANLERSLLRWLVYICEQSMEFELSIFCASREPTLVNRFKKKTKTNSQQRYYQEFCENFLQGGLLSFFCEYPVLARLMATAIDFWVEANQEFISRLASDWSDIKKTFHTESELRQVISLQSELSDRHNNGLSVILVTFANGLKIVYKPKNLNLEQGYIKLLDWLNQHQAPLQFKLYRILGRSAYGWTEFVETLPCQNQEELRRYYQRSGMLLCLTYVLDGTDLHYENIIDCGEHPVLIDMETLMHPRVREVEDSEINIHGGVNFLGHKQIWYSVLRTALLPYWQFDYKGQAYDDSGLGGVSQPVSIQILIVNGFEKMYRFLIENRQALLEPDSPLTKFKSQSIRFIFRHTQTYTLTLHRVLHPNFLHNGVDWSNQLDILGKPLLLLDKKPCCWPLFEAEKQALEKMDIPLFTARSDSNTLIVSEDIAIKNYFIEPSFNTVIKRLKNLNYNDLQEQILFIRSALYARITEDIHHVSLSDNFSITSTLMSLLTQKDLLVQVFKIANNLERQAIRSDDSATWLTPQYLIESQRLQIQPMGSNLYEGTCGLALLLAALETTSLSLKFKSLTLGVLQPFIQDIGKSSFASISTVDIGGGMGISSVIYSLVHACGFLRKSELLENAAQIASFITPALIAADKEFDIISGAAGAILGLLAFHNVFPNAEPLEKAILCGNHLLNNRVVSKSGYRTWATLNGKLLTGFSHGAAGIAYALLRLYKATGETRFKEAAAEAIAYERSVFIPELNNWPDFRQSQTKDNPKCMCSWCHGAPGIGLARVATLDILDTPEIRQDIEAAITTTLNYGLSDIDHLCCGNMGRVEFLFTAGRKLNRPELVDAAMKITSQVVARAEQKGHYGYGPILDFHPGFFQGASGIGYQLLRLAYPDQLPSVLLWE